jgi:hypothetical protein
MTRDQLSDISIGTAAEFEEVLAEAVERAIANGVNVRGAWELQTRGSTDNWDVEIFELTRTEGGDEDAEQSD